MQMSRITKSGKEDKRCKPHSLEHKQKLSEGKKGIGNPYWGIIGEGHPRFGTIHSDETKKKISNSLKERYKNRRSYNFKGTDIKYWKSIALERDNYTCQHCGLYDPEIMQVDHIKPKYLFPELNLILENLSTLCPNCHARKTRSERRKWESGFQ